MHGKGDRTKTAPEDSAGEQRPGSTAHKTSSRGSVLAEGGSERMLKRQAADPSSPGHTGKSMTRLLPSRLLEGYLVQRGQDPAAPEGAKNGELFDERGRAEFWLRAARRRATRGVACTGPRASTAAR